MLVRSGMAEGWHLLTVSEADRTADGKPHRVHVISYKSGEGTTMDPTKAQVFSAEELVSLRQHGANVVGEIEVRATLGKWYYLF